MNMNKLLMIKNYLKLKQMNVIMWSLPIIAYIATMPIPIPIHHGGGSMMDKQSIAFLIALNIPSVLIVIIRSLMWIIKRPDWTYVEYVWYSDTELLTPDINTMYLAVVDGMAAVLIMTIYIAKII